MKARVCQSRKNMHSVMNNGGYFGDMTISRNGLSVNVPSEWLFKDSGRVKKYAEVKVNRMFKKLEKQLEKEIA